MLELYFSCKLLNAIFFYLYTFSMMFRYATASARSDGLLLLCGGRDANSVVSGS